VFDLIEANYDKLQVLAGYINPEDPLDLLHDTILRVVDSKTYQEEGHFLAYMYRAMYNTFLSQCTKASAKREVLMDEWPYSQRCLDAHEKDKIHAKTTIIKEGTRRFQVLSLYLEGHLISDIALELDLTVSQVNYALKKIRECLGDNDGL
jgi:DNA-directed RNA polymerase specialized sigma24 family protein